MFSFTANAQLTGIKTIPGDYATIAAAVNDLNTQGVGAGGVTFNIAAGYSENLAGKIILTATGTAANPIVFQKSGAGLNPVLNAYVGTVATPSVVADGFFVLAGSDYVTIDGINLAESAANLTTTTVMEFGYGLFKASATDGCQNNVIKNCTITLDRLQNTAWTAPGHNGSTGIAVLNGLYTATGAVTVTAAGGSNSNNQIYSNTIQNCNAGIVFVGYADASPFTLGDTNNDVGGNSAATGNMVLNFGGGAATNPATGIFANNQWGLNCSYNTINNNNGSGVNHPSTLRGIFLNASSTSASANCNFNNITIKGGGTTSQVTGIENSFGSTAAGNTINLNNNTITGEYLTATGGAFYGIYSTSTPATLNMNNNTVSNIVHGNTSAFTSGILYGLWNSGAATTANINNNTVSGFTHGAPTATGTGAIYPIYNSGAATTVNANGNNVSNISRTGSTGGTTIGIYLSSGTTQSINNNTITNMSIDGTGATSIMYGIQATGTTVTVNNNAVNNLNCLKTSGTGAMYGIYNFGTPSNENYNFNTVNNLTHNGTGITYGIYTFTTTGTRTMSNNTVHTITAAGTTVAGINNASSSPNVFNNKVYNIASTSTGAPTVSGIIQGSLGTSGVANIYNNLIGDIKAPFASGAALVRGINISTATATTSVNVSYNTVYLNAASSGANFGSAALYVTTSTTSTTANLTLRNNILVNTSTAAGTGFTVAYQRSTTALNNYNTASNNNLFYAGAVSATNLIFYDGTNSDQTLAAYKARVAPADAASVTENPAFLSTNGSHANFLHINTTVPTQIESGGTPVTGITTDFDGNTRNATTPDIGGDEFAGIPVDMTPPSIVYTALSSTCSTGSRTLTATITDASGVPTSGIGLPVLYWKINAGSYVSSTGTYLGSNQYEFTLGAGSVSGDVISYYIVAQDLVAPPIVGAFPSAGAGGFTANPPAAMTPPTTPSTYTNLAALSGTKTVGASGDYATLTAAVAAYNTSCLSGPVTFSLIDASYPSETFPIVINENLNASATNTLTIKPASGVSPVITGAVGTGAIIKLNGADYVIIDGSNSTGTRDLTISNTTTTASGNAVIWLASPAANNGSSNNTVKNCIIEGNSQTTTFLGMYVGGNATISLTAAGNALNNNNTINNNLFRKTQYGLALFGFAAASPDLNNVISNNNFGTPTAGEGFNLEGIHSDRQQNLIVSGNDVQNVKGTSATNMYGIRLLDFKNGQAFNNKVHDIGYTGTSTTKVYGIAVQSSTYTTVANPSQSSIYNNFVYQINSSGTSAVWNVTGILASQGHGDKYYYNSIDLSGQINNSSTGLSAAFANGDGNLTTACTNIDVRNNIINLSGSSLGGNVWAYYTTATTFAGATQNNNLIRCAGTGATNNTGRFNGINYATLATWQAGSGVDANSIETQPVFTSLTDLHLIPASNATLDGLGTPIAGITLDIDMETRNATNPDMGADEFTPPPCTAAVGGTAATAGATTFCGSGSAIITNSGYSTGSGTTYEWQRSTDNFVSNIVNTGQTNPSSFNTGTITTTTSYRLRVACATNSSVDFSNVITITITPSVAAISPASPSICAGASVTLSETGGTGTSWTWAPGGATTSSIMVSPTSTTTYTVTVTSPGACTATASVTVVVNPVPTNPMASASSPSVCAGQTVNLTSSADTPPGTILSQNFDSGLGGWSVVNGTPHTAGTEWIIQTPPYTYSTLITNWSGFNSTPFIVANSDAGGSGSTTATRLVSPSFSTAGYTSASLSFDTYFRALTEAFVGVEYSTNGGGTWTSITTTPSIVANTSVPSTASSNPPGTVNVTASLPAGALGQSAVMLRFRYDASWDYYWGMDNVSLTGIFSGYTYSWTSSPAGFTSSVQNPMNVAPTANTTYTVVITGVGGCTATASTSVTVNPLPNVTFAPLATVCITDPAFALTGGSPSGGTYSGPGVSAGMFNPANAGAGTHTITYTYTNANNCTNSATSSITVNQPSTFYQDSDGDGYGNTAVSVQACVAPMGYVSNNTDCNDGNAAINPAATEVCNGIDDNCNGQTDEGVQLTFYQDSDGDGYGNLAVTTQACSAPMGYVANSNDCNDGNSAINPAATEVCNGIDDNCNGQTDEGVQLTFYQDSDGDGFGNPAATTQACSVPMGYVANNMDCNDGNAAINPNTVWYKDSDNDGYSDGTTATQCTQPTGYKLATNLIALSGDCNDNNGAIHPGATEVCNGIDDNCNNQIDEGASPVTWYRDMDGDGYGNAAITTVACNPPAGYVGNSTDCNDNNAAINPGATEICDGIDNNCNSQTDEGVLLTFYQDSDGDGYGNAAVSTQACSAPMGYVSNSTDCNDGNAAINPGATEICDGIDNNCNGQTDEGVLLTFYQDSDGDGFGNPAATTQACSAPMGYVSNSTDCNDGNAAINPGATEICDGIDNNCDGQTDNFVSGITVSNLSQCDANGTVDPVDDTFTANVTVTFGTIPASGFLNLTGDGTASVAVGSLSGNSYTFTNVTMSADGTAISLTAEFSAAAGCGFTNGNAGTAPSNCSGNCFVGITSVVTTPEGCAGSNSGTITIEATASAGQLGYSINGGASFQLQNVFNNVPAGTYNIVVLVYGGGCSTSGIAVVGGPTGQTQTWYKDIDGDGYSDGVSLQSCTSPGTGWYLAGQLTATSGDCNDYDANQYPGQTWYKDTDNDGYSDGTTLVQCAQPAGYKIAANLISALIDCNDSNAAIHPGAVEICNGIDDNCNGQIDEGLADLTFNGNVTFTTQTQVNNWNLCYTVINGNLTIKNTSINDITRLINLRKVTGFVSIENTSLDSLVGLINLDTIGGNLTIKQNSKLETLSGIDSLKRVSGSLAIFFNLKLTDCCPIYSLLLNPNGVGGSVSIYANKTGCDSVPQVLAECDPSSPIIAPSGGQYGNVSNKEILQQRVDLFPNPATEEVTIMIQKEFNSGALKFYDLQGRLLKKAELDANTFQHRIKLGDLPQGTYLVQVLLDGSQFVQKLVIE
jgi:trimeric autotransporter adhesin